MTRIDPVTSAVIQAGFEAAADEMFAVLRRTAMSPIIHEVLDVGTGVTDGEGRLVSSGAGIPTFVGVLDKAVARIIEVNGRDSIAEGDMFITNDPAFGGVTHLNDVVVASPVFHDGVLLAWAASIAHWSDVGGMTPGSMSTGAREIHQEGLRLPAVRLFGGAEPVEAVFSIIEANTRMPEVTAGDLWAQIAAARRASQRIREVAARYGRRAVDQALDALFDADEARVRSGLADLPPGRHAIGERQDDGSLWQAAITIGAGRFAVDLTGNPGQMAAPFNTSRDGSVIAAQMVLKALADPGRAASDGSFRPLEVITEPGSVFHATGTAPHGYYFETRIRLFDLLWRCLADAMPGRLPAGHFGSICGTVIAGDHPDTGRRFTMVEPQMGGWGASARHDGLDCMFSASHGDTYNCPVEVCEARYGIEVGWKRLNEDPAGRGLRSGGRGLEVCYRLRSRAVVATGISRHRVPVWGLGGGGEGGTNAMTLIRRDGTREVHGMASGLEVDAGDTVLIRTADGGGWGPRPVPDG